MDSKHETNISEEVYTLLEMHRHIELQISSITELQNFKEYFLNKDRKQLSPFINSFLDNYSKKEMIFSNNNILLLKDYLNKIKQELKNNCPHNYCEDEIETPTGDFQKITYCQICYSTF